MYIELKNINKIYPNGFHAVHNFNLEIDKGEFIRIVADNTPCFSYGDTAAS